MELLTNYKKEIERVDNIFESKHKNYDPYIKFMKFYVKFKNGKIKRYGATGFYRPRSFYSQNVDFLLYSKNGQNYELKKIIFSSLSYVRRYEYIPYFFYYNKDLNIYCHLKYNRLYNEDEIDDLFAYVIKYNDSKLQVLKNKEALVEKNDVTSWYTNIEKPENIIFSCEEKNEIFDNTIYIYDLFENKINIIGKSNSRFITLPQNKLYDILNKLPSNKILFDDDFVYFYISYSDTEEFYIIFEYIIKNADRIDIIKNLFIEDTTINYKVTIKRSKRKELQFILWIIYSKRISRLSIYNYELKDICDNLCFEDNVVKKIQSYKNNEDINKVIDLLKNKYNIKNDEELVNHLVKVFKKENVYDLIFKSGYNNEYLKVQSYCEFLYPEPNQNLYQNIKKSLYNNVTLHKWKSEYSLFKLIRTYFPDSIYQFKSDWLGLQSLDIYIPSLKIAFEYQGLQHYEAVGFFGGEKGLEDNMQRDSKKREICKKYEITLIYWRYDEKITKDNLVKKLSQFNINLDRCNIFGIENLNVDDKYTNFNLISL